MKKAFFALLLLLFPASAHATFTLTQHRTNAACGGVNSCNVTGFSAIAAGSFAFETIINDGSAAAITATTGASGGGSWVLPTGCTGTGTAACAAASGSTNVAVAYIASTINAPTTMTCTSSTTVMRECGVVVLTFTNGPVTLDVGATRIAASGTNLAGVSAGTITGTNDVIFQSGSFSGTASGCPNSGTGDFPNGNAVCTGPVNSTSNTAGNYTSTSGTGALVAIAFKEAAASTFRTQVGAFTVGP